MKFDILTIFPDIFASYINKGMIRIALEKKIKKIINSREIVKKKVNLLIKINIRELLGVLPKDKIHEDQK